MRERFKCTWDGYMNRKDEKRRPSTPIAERCFRRPTDRFDSIAKPPEAWKYLPDRCLRTNAKRENTWLFCWVANTKSPHCPKSGLTTAIGIARERNPIPKRWIATRRW